MTNNEILLQLSKQKKFILEDKFSNLFNDNYLLWLTLLQAWVRDIKNYDIFCDCVGNKLYYSIIYDNNTTDRDDKIFEQKNTTSYEIALETGLLEIMKIL